jgi:drug/metabolite transporter (DMT)-like permease
MRIDRGFAALLTTVVIWASTFVVTKAALADLGPLTLTAARFAVALVALAPAARPRGLRPRLLVRPAYILGGLTGVALFFALQNVGLTLTSAASASLIHASTPAIISLSAVALLGERLNARQAAGVALAVAGSALVAVAAPAGQQGANPLLGNLLMFGSVLAWAVYTVLGKRLAGVEDPLVSTAAGTAVGLACLLPLAAIEIATQGPPRLTWAGAGSILYLGVAASALTLVLWNYALSRVPASTASAFINLVPIAGALLAVLAGEALSLAEIGGGLLALAGVWLSAQGAGTRRAAGEANA